MEAFWSPHQHDSSLEDAAADEQPALQRSMTHETESDSAIASNDVELLTVPTESAPQVAPCTSKCTCSSGIAQEWFCNHDCGFNVVAEHERMCAHQLVSSRVTALLVSCVSQGSSAFCCCPLSGNTAAQPIPNGQSGHRVTVSEAVAASKAQEGVKLAMVDGNGTEGSPSGGVPPSQSAQVAWL